MQDNHALSHPHSQSGSPVSTSVSTPNEHTMHSSFGQMRPQNWIGPISLPWDMLGTGTEGYGFD